MHLLKRDKEKSRERLRFPAGRWSTRATNPQGWHYWPSNRAGCWGLITERERHINVSLHSSSAISQLRDGKFWCLLRSLELFVLFCLDLLESQTYNPMTTLAKTTRLDSTHSNENKPSILIIVPSFMSLSYLLAHWSGRQVVTTHLLTPASHWVSTTQSVISKELGWSERSTWKLGCYKTFIAESPTQKDNNFHNSVELRCSTLLLPSQLVI